MSTRNFAMYQSFSGDITTTGAGSVTLDPTPGTLIIATAPGAAQTLTINLPQNPVNGARIRARLNAGVGSLVINAAAGDATSGFATGINWASAPMWMDISFNASIRYWVGSILSGVVFI